MKAFLGGLKNAISGQSKKPDLTIPVRPLQPPAELTDEQRATIQRENFIASNLAEPLKKVDDTENKE